MRSQPKLTGHAVYRARKRFGLSRAELRRAIAVSWRLWLYIGPGLGGRKKFAGKLKTRKGEVWIVFIVAFSSTPTIVTVL